MADRLGIRMDGYPSRPKVVLDSCHKVLSMSAKSNPILVCGSPFAEKAALGLQKQTTCHGQPTDSVCSPRIWIPANRLRSKGNLISSLLLCRQSQAHQQQTRPFFCWRAGEAQASNGRCRGRCECSLMLPHARRYFSPSRQGCSPDAVIRRSSRLSIGLWPGLIPVKKELRPANCKQRWSFSCTS